jgi:hypothetical protein
LYSAGYVYVNWGEVRWEIGVVCGLYTAVIYRYIEERSGGTLEVVLD